MGSGASSPTKGDQFSGVVPSFGKQKQGSHKIANAKNSIRIAAHVHDNGVPLDATRIDKRSFFNKLINFDELKEVESFPVFNKDHTFLSKLEEIDYDNTFIVYVSHCHLHGKKLNYIH